MLAFDIVANRGRVARYRVTRQCARLTRVVKDNTGILCIGCCHILNAQIGECNVFADKIGKAIGKTFCAFV